MLEGFIFVVVDVEVEDFVWFVGGDVVGNDDGYWYYLVSIVVYVEIGGVEVDVGEFDVFECVGVECVDDFVEFGIDLWYFGFGDVGFYIYCFD